MFTNKDIKLGICPIGWTNDDMWDLGDENTFQQCISEMRLAGFTGCEVGHKYPSDVKELKEALDLRGMLDALRLIRRGIPAGAALDMGITNKAFDSYEQGLIRDVIAARIPAKLDAGKLFA